MALKKKKKKKKNLARPLFICAVGRLPTFFRWNLWQYFSTMVWEHLGNCIHHVLSEDLLNDLLLSYHTIIFELCLIAGVIRIQNTILFVVEFCYFLKMNIKITFVRIWKSGETGVWTYTFHGGILSLEPFCQSKSFNFLKLGAIP
jgi:hypothetical protein